MVPYIILFTNNVGLGSKMADPTNHRYNRRNRRCSLETLTLHLMYCTNHLSIA